MVRWVLKCLAVLAGLLLIAVLAALFIGRSLFAEPGVERLGSVREALGEAGVLFVFAHPDDEITANALMARAVDEGVPVHLFTATRGEAGTQYPPVVDQPHLGVVREAEARKHGFALGVASHTVLDLGDGQLRQRPFDELVERVAAEITRTRPSAVVTFHPESAISLHPDHMAIGEAARRAVEALGEEAPRLVYVLAPRPGLRRFGGERGQLIAEIQPDPDFAVPSPSRDKQRAWRIHESQSRYLQATYGIGPRVMYALWTEEYYAFAGPAD
ncbi:MAG: PIG-L deacetylase family protein [Caulobacterales bacterium]|uniref:PIG-L deacetylase family protein n=1 Tax=Glycocaulis sp. TaxID=1969725 RepID=UPI003F9F9457